MPKQTKVCRVCGKTYEACRSIKTGSDVFNWREVACSPECGKIYLQQVLSSREKPSHNNMKNVAQRNPERCIVDKHDDSENESAIANQTVSSSADLCDMDCPKED